MWPDTISTNKWYNGVLLKCICAGVLAVLPTFNQALAVDKSRWVSKPIVIDANNEEWPQPYPFKEEITTNIQYAIANDAQTLYLTVKTSDDATKMKLWKNGLMIVVDTTGKKLKNTSFDFTAQGDEAIAGEQMLRITNIQVNGIPGYDGSYKTNNNKAGISVAAAINDFNELVWEIAIPFKCIYTTVDDHVTDREKISVCFTILGLDNGEISELDKEVENENKNLPPDMDSITHATKGNADAGGTPVRGANGGMGVGIGGGGGGKGKGGGGASSEAPVIDATAAAESRHRAGADDEVWKLIRLSYEQE